MAQCRHAHVSRSGHQSALRPLAPDYVAEESGQTMHFFSESYLRELLASWRQVHLVQVLLPGHKTGGPAKQVWRGLARR